MRDRVRVRDFEAALLQIVAVIQNRAADEERAFWIDHHAHIAGLDHDVAIRRTIDEIHLVLQPGTAAADHGHPQGSLRAPLLLQKRRELARGVLGHFDETLVPDLEFDLAVRRIGCGHEGIYATSEQSPLEGNRSAVAEVQNEARQ